MADKKTDLTLNEELFQDPEFVRLVENIPLVRNEEEYKALIERQRKAFNMTDALSTSDEEEWTDLNGSVKRLKVDAELALEPTANKNSNNNVFVNSMDTKQKETPDTKTENGAPSFSTTSVARMDLFWKLLRGATQDQLWPLMAASWKENPKHTVQLLMHARDCRGGKGEKEIVYICMFWLRQHKPKTYVSNLRTFISHGCFKDLLTLAARLSPLTRPSGQPPIPPNANDSKNEKKSFLQALTGNVPTTTTTATATAAVSTTTIRGRGGRGRGMIGRGRGMIGRGRGMPSRGRGISRGAGGRGGRGRGRGAAYAVREPHSNSATATTGKVAKLLNQPTLFGWLSVYDPELKKQKKEVTTSYVYTSEMKSFYAKYQNDTSDAAPDEWPAERDVVLQSDPTDQTKKWWVWRSELGLDQKQNKIPFDDITVLDTVNDTNKKIKVVKKDELVEMELLASFLADDIHEHQKWESQKKVSKNTNVTAVTMSDDAPKEKEVDLKAKEKLKGKRKAGDDINNAKTDCTEESTDKKTPKVTDEDVKKFEKLKISLAAKWAPTERTAFDKEMNGHLSLRLANLLFPSVKKQTARQKRYRQTMSRLRNCIRVVESLMCSGKWNRINFSGVPARAHHLLKEAFTRHEPTRYAQYLQDLQSNKAGTSIKTAGIYPHELVKPYLSRGVTEPNPTVEAQWKTILDKLNDPQNGKLGNVLAISDVSGSMDGTPLQVSVALGIVCAMSASPPFKGRMLTFSRDPTWHILNPAESLCEQVKGMVKMAWDMSTDLLKAYRLILQVAVDNKVPAKDMPTTLFIFSDMQFDAATERSDPQKSIHQIATAEFKTAGYSVPQIVYWNLRSDTIDFPVGDANTPGVAMVSGFSQQLLKLFMNGEAMTPMSILLTAIVDYSNVIIDPTEI